MLTKAPWTAVTVTIDSDPSIQRAETLVGVGVVTAGTTQSHVRSRPAGEGPDIHGTTTRGHTKPPASFSQALQGGSYYPQFIS